MPRDLASLRQLRAAAIQKLEALQAKDGGNLSAEDQTAFDGLVAEIDDIDKRIANAKKLNQLKASTAITSIESEEDAEAGAEGQEPAAGGSAGTGRVAPQAKEKPAPGILFAQTTRALIAGRGNVDAAARFAAQTWGERHEVTAALQANDASAGGFLVPERFSAEMIDLLRPKTIIRKNAAEVPLVGGKDSMPTVEEGSAAYYIGEGADIGTTEPKFGALNFVEREIAAIVPISNKLLRHAAIRVDVTVRDDLLKAFAQTEDMVFLRSKGLGAAPKGLRYFAHDNNVIPANATVSLENIDKDSRKAINCLATADIPMMNVRWLMNPTDFGFLQDMRDGNGNLVYPGLQLPTPVWKGFAVEQSNNVPANLGGGGDESEIYLVDFGEAVVADSYKVTIDANESATYKVAGEVRSAYSQNQTLIRALAGHDFGVKRRKAVAVLTGVKWGRG